MGNACLVAFGAVFLGFGHLSFIKESEQWVLYVVYIGIGIFAAPINPCIYRWASKIKPLKGMVSALIIVSPSLGDSTSVAMMSQLIGAYGADIVPMPIFGYIVLSLMVTII